MPVIDMTGQKFGRWTVLERVENTSRGTARWKCQCDCGKIGIVTGTDLRNGHSKSCGCLKKELQRQRIKDITNQKFGHLTALKPILTSDSQASRVIWECQCDCGNIVQVRATNLMTGNSQSCGHCQHISHGEELIATILNEKNISYERQKTFTTCRFLDTNKLAFFDFYLPDYNILIEYDGEQHFSYRNNGWNTKERYIQTQQRDNFKNQWCKENNIPLIRIPYTDYNKIKLNNNYLITLIQAKLLT